MGGRNMSTTRFAVEALRALHATGPIEKSIWIGQGFVLLKPKRHLVVLDSLWVCPERRGGGHGRDIMGQVLRHFDSYGMTVELRVAAYNRKPGDPGNKVLKIWYASMGFEVVKTRRHGTYMQRRPQPR